MLNLPVSYQNLLDGVIEFVVSDGHGGTQTVVPVAYTPNNDLYVSADQGGFEVINVHPGSDLYTELVLTENWSGSGKSLISINVKPGPRIVGLPGTTYWPSINSVSHEAPAANFVVYFENSDVEAKITLEDRLGVSANYVSQNGVLTIPAVDLVNAIERRVSLNLEVNQVEFSTLFFLPEVETEPFLNNGYIKENGEINPVSNYGLTNLIDLYDVTEIVYSGLAYGSAVPIAAYEEDGTFIKTVLEGGTYDSVHIVLDGTYRYIKACGWKERDMLLKLYFRTRG